MVSCDLVRFVDMNNLFEKITNNQKEIEKYKPFDKEILKQLKEYYRISFTYTSNALEGNSLTESETKIVLEDGITIGGKPIRDHQEALGHSEAYDLLYTLVQKNTIDEHYIMELHRLFYYRIDIKNAGTYRKVGVIVTGRDTVFPAPKELPSLMNSFITEINSFKKEIHPVECAALVHSKFVNIHPFIDGNGRCARLLMNLFLFKNNYPITIIPPIKRGEYLDVVYQGNNGDFKPFIHFLAELVYESQKDYVRLLKNLQKK